MNTLHFMNMAIDQAKKAYNINEVPIGCVIVHEDKVIAKAYNRRNKDKSTLSHAEILAIKKACKKLGDWRLENCTMYITLEPCPMCAGAIVQSRIEKVVIGCLNLKAGCAGSIINLFDIDKFNHQVELEICKGSIHEECSMLLKSFFKKLRSSKAPM